MILVTGGTGTLGSALVPKLQATCACSAGARAPTTFTGDLTTGEGIDAAVEGVDVIIHSPAPARATSARRRRSSKRPSGPARRTSSTSRSSAPTASRSSPAPTARCSATSPPSAPPSRSWPSRDCRGRRCARPSSTTSRAKTVSGMAKLPVIPVPSGLRWQPIETDEVAARLVELALGAPAGLVDDIAGPRVYGDGRVPARLPEGDRQAPRADADPAPRPGRARVPRRAPTWRRITPSASGPGRTSWPSARAPPAGAASSRPGPRRRSRRCSPTRRPGNRAAGSR